MSKWRSLKMLLIAVLAFGAVNLAAEHPAQAQKALRVRHVINGTLGDRSFFDSAQSGVERAQKELGIDLTTIQLGEDQSRWETGIDDAMAEVDKYDVMVFGGSSIVDFVMARADKYPDKKFIFHDEPIDFSKCKCANVYNVIYAQNEGSYLAGVYAAAMLKEGKLANTSGKNIIGAIGGMDIPVINDFIVGYEQGAKSITPDITVLKRYIGGDNPWADKGKGKELALAMYEQGADLVFSIAGGSGLGSIEAARDTGHYAIGVDSDQWLLLKDRDPKSAAQVLTSMLKNVGNVLYRALDLELKGQLPYGKTEIVGVAAGATGLAQNEYYNQITPDSVKQLVAQAQMDIMTCKVTVATALQPRPCVPSLPATPEATPAK